MTLWQRLIRFLDYPVLELSNNLAENAIRPVALGRRNWIHIGSKEAGPRVAAIISVVETCRRLKIPLRNYLGSVLPGLGDFPVIAQNWLSVLVLFATHVRLGTIFGPDAVCCFSGFNQSATFGIVHLGEMARQKPLEASQTF